MPRDNEQHPSCSFPEESGISKGACNHKPAVRQGRSVDPLAAGSSLTQPPYRPHQNQTSSRENHNGSKSSEPYHLQQANLQRNSATNVSYEAPSTLLTTSSAIEGSPTDVVPRVNSSSGSDSGRPPTALQDLHPTSTRHQPRLYPPGPDVGGSTTLGTGQYLKTTPGTPQDDSLYSRSFLSTQSGVEVQDFNNLATLYGSSLLEQHALLQQFSLAHPTANQADNTKGCNCTPGHAYASCSRFSEHFWAWPKEGRIKNDSCTCPPVDEGLLALECPKLPEHVQVGLDADHFIVPTTGVTEDCSCPNAEHYISAWCPLYSQHLNRASEGKHLKNPSSCSCAKPFVLVSRSCMTCISWICKLEMDKMYESGRQSQSWDVEPLIANASAMLGSNETNVERSVTNEDHLQCLSAGFLGTSNDAETVDSLGQRSIEGQGRHLNALSPSSHKPSHRVSRVQLDVDENSRRVVAERVDGLLPRVGYGDSPVTRSTKDRKRSAPVGSPPSRIDKKRKIEPPSEVPPDHEPSTSFPPARPSEGFGASCGGKNCKAKPLSAIPQAEYYYRKNTPADQTYFDNVIQKLRMAPYLGHPQELESTISSEGIALVGDVRNEGPGRASDGESVYSILVDKPPSGPFICWICGHLENQRKLPRAVGHVREHFGHRPWECPQDHGTVQDEGGNPKRRQGKGKDGRCGKRFSYKEALGDHQAKCEKIYPCRIGNCKGKFSTPSNRSKHERTQHRTVPPASSSLPVGPPTPIFTPPPSV